MAPHIYESQYPPINVPTNLSVAQFLLRSNPDDIPAEQTILCEFDDPTKSITYGGIRVAAARGAAGLKAVLGMKQGDTVCILAENCVNWAVLAHSIHWGGGCFSAVNPLATAYELVHYFGISEPTIIATTFQNLDKVEKALELSGRTTYSPKIVIIEDETLPSRKPNYLLFPRDVIDDQRPSLPPLDLSNADGRLIPAAMCFSSGTSGKPKGVLLSHYGLIAHLLTLRSTDPFLNNGHHREVFFAPFPHIYGIVAVIMSSAFHGSYVMAMKRFDFKRYIERCAEIRATTLRLVPSTAVLIAKDSGLQRLDLTSVRYILCSGAALQSQIVEKLHSLMAETEIVQGYGMSEISITLLRGNWSSKKAGSCGRPSAGVLIRVVDDNYVDVRPGEQGECLVKSPTSFMRYKNNRTETEASFKDGWFCTGDIVRVDEDGFFWLTDRKKELIKYKGNQVPPAELEDVLLSHPQVMDAAVCGIYDVSQQTEIPMGYVSLDASVARADIPKVLHEVRRYVDERVSPYKRLRGGVHYLAVIPKGPTGKVLRRALPARLEAQKQLDRPKL